MTALGGATTTTTEDLETPAPSPGPGRVAILGAGPIGLDAALACLDNGWPCTVYESAASVAANVTAWSHIRLFTPWSMNASPRMLAHLQAVGVEPPGPAEHCPTGGEFAEKLLHPLAELPELASIIRRRTRVLAVARQGLLKHEKIGSLQCGSHPFRLLLAGPDDVERVEHADLLLDCTGSYGQANFLGDGGIPAPGELRLADRITRRIPDLAREGDTGDVEEIVVDRITALTGFLGDTSLYRQLQVHECYATAAPMNLSAALLGAAGDGTADCLAQASHGVAVLRVPEPNFFVLGMKSYGRNSTFLLRVGYEQVDEVVSAYSQDVRRSTP